MVVVTRDRGEPRSLRSDSQYARHLYKRCSTPQHADHAKRVVDIERKVGIVEGHIITDPRQSSERRWSNSDLFNWGAYHGLNVDKIGLLPTPLPPALRDKVVLAGLEKIGEITNLDCAGAPTSHYAGLLNGGGKPPLVLLVKLADYAVTHTTEHMLDGLIDSKHASAFRTYDSEAHAYRCMRNEARAGEKIYAPIAELFGYPELAGKIMNHAYRINHPFIHAQVTSAMADELFQTRLALTQKVVRQIASHMRAELKRYGFEADVTLRPQKSEGKIMRKVYRLLKRDYEASREHNMLTDEICNRLDEMADGRGHTPIPDESPEQAERSLEQYIRSAIKSFNFDRLNDWVAARVVLKKYKGREVEGDTSKPFNLAKAIIEHALHMQQLIHGSMEVNHEEKRGRYNADHYDVRTIHEHDHLIGALLNLEIQLKIEEWHDIAEHGKAAHYYYLGGDPDFMDAIAKAYYDIIHGHNGNGRKR